MKFFVKTYEKYNFDIFSEILRDRSQISPLILTHEMPVLPSYRNQPIDLLCKSIDWFLYEGNIGISWVKLI